MTEVAKLDELRVGGLTLTGITRGGVETCLMVPELSLMFDVGKNGGKGWHSGVGGDVRSPGFEANDLGFHGGADYLIQFSYLNYRRETPAKHFSNWRINPDPLKRAGYAGR